MADIVDVAIIGSGFSGLQAALDLQDQLCSFIVLEARDRVGGKAWSRERPDGKGVQEMGACWFNDTNQARVWKYVEKFGLTPVLQNIEGSVACEDMEGKCQLFPFTGLPNFDGSDQDSIVALRTAVESASLDPETFRPANRAKIDKLTFEQWCRRLNPTEKALQTATVWCRGTTGHDPSDISALSFLEVARGAGGVIRLRYDGKHGAQFLRVQQGTQSIATGMAKLLPPESIKLSTPVTSIARAGGVSVVTTSNGLAIKARRVLISVPSPAYKSITFDPPLPRRRFAYTTLVRYGCYIKHICLFQSPWWRQLGACGLSQSFRGPVNHCRDTSVDALENYALTCFVTSAPGRKWLSLNKADQREAIVYQLGSLFGVGSDKVREELIETMTSEWMQDPWAGWGCPFASAPTGTTGEFEDEWWRETGDGLYFVGTELTNEWRGYMEGAMASGERGAAQILADIRSDQSRL